MDARIAVQVPAGDPDALYQDRENLASAQKAALPRPRIIGLSANAMAEDVQAALHAGMDDYLAKPITPIGLREVITRWGR